MLRSLGAVLIALLLIGCGATAASNALRSTPSATAAPTPDAGTERCLSSHYTQSPPTPTLAAVFETDAATLAHWIETRHGPNGPRPVATLWRAQPANQTVWVCYFDGSNMQPPSGGNPAPYDRFRVFVTASGFDVLDAVGRSATMPLDPPR